MSQKPITFFAAIIPIILLIFSVAGLQADIVHHPVGLSLPWFPRFGVNLSFLFDGLGLIFTIFVSLIGILVVLYSGYYLKDSKIYNRYVLYLILFMLAMIGSVLADNLIVLFVFWEATSITSYLLICYNYHKEKSRRAALQGLIVTMSGGIGLLLFSFGVYFITGTFKISALVADHAMLIHNPFYLLLLGLFLLAVFTKSAQWPFHFWLPNAMEAPTPVSAYLHSATMVNLGVYLCLRFTPILGGTSGWYYLLGDIAAITLVVSWVMLLIQRDLKRYLAYSTIMALGLMLLSISDGTPLSLAAGVLFFCTHALYKAALFLSVGVIDKATGTRDIWELRGLARKMPLTFATVFLAGASFAGLPPVLGFVAKELLYEARINADTGPLFLIIIFFTSVLFVVLALLMIVVPFLGKNTRYQEVKENRKLIVFPLILALISLYLGLDPNILSRHVLMPVISNLLNQPTSIHLTLFHGVRTSFYMSLATMGTGVAILIAYCIWGKYLQKIKIRWGMELIYQKSMGIINGASYALTRVLQAGRLREYVMLVFLFVTIMLWASYLHYSDIQIKAFMPHARWFDWAMVLLLVIATMLTIVSKHYMKSLVTLGVVGLSATMIFVMYSAPDVALTQLLVDIITVVIVVLALYRLPRLPHQQRNSSFYLWRNAIIAIAFGLIVTLMMLSCLSINFDRFISEFYTANSYVLAHGQNVVNVILVDFRAFDTFGESLVVAIAGVGVYVLWRSFTQGKDK